MMSTKRDYYEILRLSKGASVDEIKKSYRQLVMKYHPDRVAADKKKESEERFKEVSEAYAVLSDSQKKQLYDQYGHAGIDSRYTTEDIFKDGDFSGIFGNGFGDIFERFFSNTGFDIFGGGRQERMSVGEDIQLRILVSLEDASKGIQKDISFYRYDNCSDCNGSGAEPGSSKVICSTCKGNGAVRSGMGFISFSQTCPTCSGEGRVIEQPCRACSGQGRTKGRKKLKVTIPKGVDSGSVLRLRGEGCFAQDGRGDLYAHITVKPHPFFVRTGDDIRYKATVSLLKAVLGSEIEIPTLYGRVKMKVPAGTQPNTLLRLRNKGITNLRTRRLGDQIIEVEIEVPGKLSSRERKLFEELAKLRKERL